MSDRRIFSLRPASIAATLVLLATACSGSGGSESSDGSSNGDATTDSGSAGESAGAVEVGTSDPAAAELEFRCGSVVFNLEQINNGVSPDGVGAYGAVGDPTGWIEIDAGGRTVLVDPIPLDAVVPAMMIAEPGFAPFPCVAVRTGVVNQRPIAWEIIDGTVAIENCVSPSDVTSDVRTVTDDGAEVTVASLYVALDDQGDVLDSVVAEEAADCQVDGSTVVEIIADLAADLTAVRDGLIYPFADPSAQTAERLGFSRGAVELSIDQAAVTCSVLSLPGEVLVSWTGVDLGLTATVTTGDETLFTGETAAAENSPSIVRAANARLAERGIADVTIPPSSSGFSDYLGDGAAPRGYQVVVSGATGTSASADCGAAAPATEGFGTVDPTAEFEGTPGSLSEAQAKFEAVAALPYVYMTVIPVCPGCSGDPVSVQLSPIDGQRVFVPPLAEQTDPNQPGLIDPFSVFQLLADAEDEGKDVSYSIDPASGYPVEWSINGEGANVTCLETDTAPPDLRPNLGCNAGSSILG